MALAAESIGVAQRTMEMSVEYAKDRKQFDRPIGSYQAVSHRCAQMLLETENARSAVYGAAWAADAEPESLPLAASIAKAYASDAGWRVPDAAIQVHGGIGFTWEHDLHFFLKRGKANAALFGDAKWHRERVADAVARRSGRPGRSLGACRWRHWRGSRSPRSAPRSRISRPRQKSRRGGRASSASGHRSCSAPRSPRPHTWPPDREDRVATGIAWAFTRSPFIVAVSALDIDEMSGGRFRLGLGSGVKRLNETWHNAEYGKPAPHLREAIEATRLIMQQAGEGEPIRYEGEYYDIDIKGWIRPHPAPRDSVPIYTAGIQSGMCRMAGDVADGLIGHPIQSLRWIDEVVVDSFESGLSRSDRRAQGLRLPADRLLCDRRRRGPGDRDGPPHDLLLRHGQDLHAALGAAWLRRQRGRRRRRIPPRGPGGRPGRDQRRDGRDLLRAGPLDKVRARVEQTAERADGLFLTPPTYFISPEELSEYQNRIIDAFGPASPGG